jgi:hypothetical protein
MPGAPGNPRPSDRPKSPVDQWFELFVYAPLGFALDARQLLPRFIDRGRSQVVLARVVGRYAVRRGSDRAGGYLGQSQEQVSALLQAFGLLPDDHEPPADPEDLDEFEADVLVFESPSSPSTARTPAARTPVTETAHVEAPDAEPEPEGAEPAPAVEGLAIPDYDNLSASQVVPRLGGLNARELEEVRRYEAAQRGRKTILNKIAQLRSA